MQSGGAIVPYIDDPDALSGTGSSDLRHALPAARRSVSLLERSSSADFRPGFPSQFLIHVSMPGWS